jgi:hypothetical protein
MSPIYERCQGGQVWIPDPKLERGPRYTVVFNCAMKTHNEGHRVPSDGDERRVTVTYGHAGCYEPRNGRSVTCRRGYTKQGMTRSRPPWNDAMA